MCDRVPTAPTSARPLLRWLFALGLALFPGCGDEGTPLTLDEERVLARAYFEEASNLSREWPKGENPYEPARELVRRIVQDPGATAQDWMNVAAVELWSGLNGDLALARDAVERARRMDPSSAAVHFVLGHLAAESLDWNTAVLEFEAAVEAAPRDAAARFRLGSCLAFADRPDEAMVQFQALRDMGLLAGAYFRPSTYKLSQLLRRCPSEEERARGAALLAEHQLGDDGKQGPGELTMNLGTLSQVRLPQEVEHALPPVDVRPITLRSRRTLRGPWNSVRDLAVADVDGDGRTDLLVASDTGSHVLFQSADHDFQVVTTSRQPTDQVIAAEFLAGPGRCLVLRENTELRLLVPKDREHWEERELPAVPAVAHVVALDFDHDGDVDLALATESGLHLLRNDHGRLTEGTPQQQVALPFDTELSFAHVAPEECGLPTRALSFVTSEDLDGGNDVDFVAVDRDGRLAGSLSLRAGRFRPVEGEGAREVCAEPRALLLHDVDGDFLPDLFTPEQGWRRGRGDGTFEAFPGAAPPPERPSRVRAAELDGDGHVDLLALDAGTLLLRAGGIEATSWQRCSDESGIDTFALGDLDELAPAEVVIAKGATLEVLEVAGVDRARFLRLSLKGREDRPSGEGCTIELYTPGGYQRWRSTDGASSLGLGEKGEFLVLRVIWPNGAAQDEWDPTAPGRVDLFERPGGLGSCPFLYTWDGERFRFQTDVLGATPLGLPIADGVYVQPDHDEWIRIESNALVPKDGEYLLQITEERREVTYLDRARLRVVDHPVGTELHPEERFCLPPFPEARLHVVRDVLPVTQAVDGKGRDWTAALAARDSVHAVPFDRTEDWLTGVVEPHHLELTLPEAVRRAPRVRLLLTGWIEWMDATTNLAVARRPDLDLELPTLWVPDGDGWKRIDPPLGFPAGITKTMVVDIADLLVREDPRLRISTSMQLYWDQIAVAVDAGDEEVHETVLEPLSARLHFHGFSARIPKERPDLPQLLDWDQVTPAPWNAFEGRLTRFGPVDELLAAVDDRFVIFSSGDAVELHFDAEAAGPVPAGFTRTFLLDVDGWAKDGDFHSYAAGRVEPLPFHGMSGYPFDPAETPPRTEAQLRDEERYQTRRATPFVGALVRPAEVARELGGGP